MTSLNSTLAKKVGGRRRSSPSGNQPKVSKTTRQKTTKGTKTAMNTSFSLESDTKDVNGLEIPSSDTSHGIGKREAEFRDVDIDMPASVNEPTKLAGSSICSPRSEHTRSNTRSKSPGSDDILHRTNSKGRIRKASGRAGTAAVSDKYKGGSWSYTHVPTRQEERKKNGRYEGRNLVIWTRPRMMEKLVLHLQYELARHKIDVPWDSVAHRLHPGSSGSAILQFLNRLRPGILAEGHLIPPPLPKPGARTSQHPSIRGYVREDMDGSDTTTMRPVEFTEPMEDRKFNLPDAFDSGNTAGPRRTAAGKKLRAGVCKNGQTAGVKQETLDPANLGGDEYNPSTMVTTPRGRRSSRAKPTANYTEASDEITMAQEHSAGDMAVETGNSIVYNNVNKVDHENMMSENGQSLESSDIEDDDQEEAESTSEDEDDSDYTDDESSNSDSATTETIHSAVNEQFATDVHSGFGSYSTFGDESYATMFPTTSAAIPATQSSFVNGASLSSGFLHNHPPHNSVFDQTDMMPSVTATYYHQ